MIRWLFGPDGAASSTPTVGSSVLSVPMTAGLCGFGRATPLEGELL